MKNWIVCSRTKPHCRLRLICFPYAGVGPSAYRGWPEAIDNAEVSLVHLPGREARHREPSLDSIPLIAEALAAEIRPLLDRPYAFFGHSLGGIVAFETARLLRDAKLRLPELFIVSSSRAPQLPWPFSPVAHLADLELLREIHRRYDSVPAAVMESEDLRNLLTPPLRTDIRSLETYRYEATAPFPFGIRVYGGRNDRMVSERSLEDWREHTSSTFGRKTFDGGHLYLQTARAELIRSVADELGALTNEIPPASGAMAQIPLMTPLGLEET